MKIDESILEMPTETSVRAYPNPFDHSVNFVINVPHQGEGSLELVNMLGQRVQTVYKGKFASGTNTFEAKLSERQSRMLIYVLNIGSEKLTGKLLQKE